MIKKKFKTCAILLLGLGLQTTHAQIALFVKPKVGANIPFNLSTLKSLTFAGSNVTVNMKDASTSSFLRSNVQYMIFGNNLVNELAPISAEQNGKLTIFPNPVHDVLNIEMCNVGLNPTQIEIVGSDGKVALRTILQNTKSSISVSYLPIGLYMLRSNYLTSTSNLKFIKQ